MRWDPERSPRQEKLNYRSLQVGVPRHLCKQWVEQWIESIEDVTETARRLKERLDQDPKVGNKELVETDLLPDERLYEVPDDIQENLEMGHLSIKKG